MRRDETPLARLQRRFWTLVVAPEGVKKALPALAADDPDAVPLDQWIVPPPGASAASQAGPEACVERLDVYANMYFYRLLSVLREDYPKVLAVAGDVAFHNLVTDYLLAHPPTDPSVRHVGARLAEFLRGHPLARTHPSLPDLAALEWTRLAVFDAADAAPLDEDVLRGIEPERWAQLHVRLVPAACLLELSHTADETWLAVQRGEPAPAPRAARVRLLVWRAGFEVRHRLVDEGEWEDLAFAREGVPFAALCERIAARVGDDAAAPLALQRLTTWLAQRLLARDARNGSPCPRDVGQEGPSTSHPGDRR